MSRWIMEGAPTLQTHCWESMIATVGSGLQPAAAIRHCRRSSSCMFSVAPRSFHPVPTASAANDAAPREDAALPPDPDMPSHQSCQARLLGQGHHRHQASPRHQIRVIERRVDLRQIMQQSHLRGVLSARERGSFSNSHRPSSEGTFRVDAPE